MNENGTGLDACIEMCLDCSESCLMTAAYCLGKGGPAADQGHITMIQLCAETCQIGAKSMILSSPVYREFCEFVAKICERCSEECLKYDDEAMEACAETCRQCAAVCRGVVKNAHRELPAGVTRLSQSQNVRI